jgi:hypothetical protein
MLQVADPVTRNCIVIQITREVAPQKVRVLQVMYFVLTAATKLANHFANI